jgi:polyhydroxyalkanoate synthesis regulator phasin
MAMKMLHTWQRRTLAAVLAGTAAVMIGVAPFAIAQAADTADAAAGASTRPKMTRQMPPMHPGIGQNARIDRMVQQGKITSEQADKLKKAIADFREKEAKDHQKFMKSLPDKTGISEATLREIMAPPRMLRGSGPQQRLQQLVKDGSITQSEATALEQSFRKHHPRQGQLPKAPADRQRPDRQKLEQELSQETGISTQRLQEIMQLMHQQGPQDGAHQVRADEEG